MIFWGETEKQKKNLELHKKHHAKHMNRTSLEKSSKESTNCLMEFLEMAIELI